MPVEFITVAEGRIAFQRQIGNPERPGIIFLGGYATDMTGSKAAFLAPQCERADIDFVRFDYGGCGRSLPAHLAADRSDSADRREAVLNEFRKGTIGGWLQDALAVFDRLTRGPQIVIGSSMGAWIAMLLAQKRTPRLKGLIGLAAAPDFTENLVWSALSAQQHADLLRDGEIIDDKAPPERRIPMTRLLIEEARHHLVLSQPLRIECPVRLIHGRRDEEVPPAYAERVATHILQDDVRLIYAEEGDHRLSEPADLALLWRTVCELL